MKKYFKMEYVGVNESVDNMIMSIEEFCRLRNKDLNFLGRFVDKKTRIRYDNVVKYKEKFYNAYIVGWHIRREKMITDIQFSLLKDFETGTYMKIREDSIIIDVWNTKIEKDTPIMYYAFVAEDIEEAKKAVEKEQDIDIWINNTKISKVYFMKL